MRMKKMWMSMAIAVSICPAMTGWAMPGAGVTPARGCEAGGHTVTSRRWDAVLNKGWEMTADCDHPDWPQRSVEIAGMFKPEAAKTASTAAVTKQMTVHVGDAVRLWQASGNVRIEMEGKAEQAASLGDRVMVRVTRQSEDTGIKVQRFAGIVRGAGSVEMEQ